jgi:CDP-diacylglycerol---glycerol-3-phosphate 3-phosphatidyltransferase
MLLSRFLGLTRVEFLLNHSRASPEKMSIPYYAHLSRKPIFMNLPNRLTVSRLVLTVAFLMAIFLPLAFRETIALFLFSAASITDYYDGKIARRRNQITDFGILMDPLADKILICSAFIAFVGQGIIPAWMVVIVVARELTITGLRLLAASKQLVLAAEKYGKHKTISQIVCILAILLANSYPHWGQWARFFFEPWLHILVKVSMGVAVALTCFSGGVYLWRNRHLYLNEL